MAGLFQLIPEPGTSFAPGWRFGWQPEIAERVLQMPWRAFVLWPRPGLHFWNSNLLDPGRPSTAGAGVLAALSAAVFLWPRKGALAAWLVGAAGLAGFGYVKFVGVVRHDGHWWLLFVAALWLGGGQGRGLGGGLPQSGGCGWRHHAFRTLLVLHCAVAAYASWMDLRHPFLMPRRPPT